MSQEYLDFELPIAELEAKIEALRAASDDKVDLTDEIKRLQKKSNELTKKTFANLDAWQVSRMARHPNRPYTLDYIEHIFTEFEELTVPVSCTVIGEGGSGGALAIGVGDKVNMLQYSTYSVISPEGCASILWKSAEKASTAAEVMGLTASRLKELNLIDSIVQEPLGGAHRNYAKMAENLKLRLKEDLAELDGLSKEELLNRRYERLMSYGYC